MMKTKFFSKKKGPVDLVASTERNIKQQNEDSKARSKATEKISSNLSQMKYMLYGDGDTAPKQDNATKLVDELFRSDLLRSLLENVRNFQFEARKDVAQIYNFVLRQRIDESVAYVQTHPEILKALVLGYTEPEIALNCGSILREVIRHEELNLMLIYDENLFNLFFGYVQLSTFDLASDAFATFKLMLTRHQASCAKFLENKFDSVFEQYNVLLLSQNYVTKRQSLKLLGELLLNRANFQVMMKYINSPDNLKIMMNLLRGTTKAIQFEAFHVFKIFVANPKKSRPVLDILVRNKGKLIEFLTKFQKEKDDDQFNEEKNILLAALTKLDVSMLASAPTPVPATPPVNLTTSGEPAASPCVEE